MNEEGKGALFALGSAALWGIYPIIVNQWIGNIPPFFFATSTSVFAALGTGIWMLIRKKQRELLNKEMLLPLFMVGMFVIFIPSTLLFWGTTMTTGMNTSILMLSEIVFTLFITPFFGERNTKEKLVGSLCIMCGALMVLYKGGFSLNFGDFLIIFSTLSFPIGNFYSKKALYYLSPSTLLFGRYFIGSILLGALTIIVEDSISIKMAWQTSWKEILIIGLPLLSLCKISFYEGMKRLDISKVISLEMTYPFFSLIVLFLFFGYQITVLQIIGILIIVLGSYFTMRRKSESHTNLKYSPKSNN